jgi:hypothetical protein
LYGRVRVGEACIAGIVKVTPQLHVWQQRSRTFYQCGNLRRDRNTDRIGEANFERISLGNPLRDIYYPLEWNFTFERAAERS